MTTIENSVYFIELLACIVFSMTGIRYMLSEETDKSLYSFASLCAATVLWGNMAYVSCWNVLFDSRSYSFEAFASLSVVMFILFSVFIGIRILTNLKLENLSNVFLLYLMYFVIYSTMVMLCKSLFIGLNKISENTEILIDINEGIMGGYYSMLVWAVPTVSIIGIVLVIAFWIYETKYKVKNENCGVE